MLSKIEGLMNLCIGKLIDSSKLALENIWTQANFALEIDGLMNLCIGKLMDLCKSCIGKYIQANFALEMDGLMNLCIGKLMDYRRFYSFGHYGHFIQ